MTSTGAIEGEPQALLARVAQVTDDGLAIVRSEQIEWTNDALSTIFGRAPEELIGAHLASLRVEELRSDQERRLLDLGALLEDQSVTRMGRVVAADGPARAVAVSAVRLDLTQRRWLLTFRSVTDQTRERGPVPRARHQRPNRRLPERPRRSPRLPQPPLRRAVGATSRPARRRRLA
jgi:PAS domain S-box-containing protein